MNWTSAALDCSLAKISNIDQLCDAQTELEDETEEYWTALKERNGSYYWGNVSGSYQPATHLNSFALLDKTQPGNC